MPRSKSRSPRREKKRSRSKEREKGGETRRRPRSRSKSPQPSSRRNRSRSRSPRRRHSQSPRRRSRSRDNDVVIVGTSYVPPAARGPRPPRPLRHIPHDDDVMIVQDPSQEEQDMKRLMGFGGFDTTKNKQVPGADVSAANIVQKRKYRQYMNRRGGFNRPLDFVA